MENEKVEKIGWGFVKWVIGIVITLVLLSGIFWLILYSSDLNSVYFLIPARNWYQSVVGLKTPALNYEIQQQKPLTQGLNTYTLTGTISKFDVANHLIFITSSNNNTYVFNAGNNMFQDSDSWLKTVYVNGIQELATFAPPNNLDATPTPDLNLIPSNASDASTYPSGIPIVMSGSQILISGDKLEGNLGLVGIRWNDLRTLDQIKKDYKDNPATPLDQKIPGSFILAEFKK